MAIGVQRGYVDLLGAIFDIQGEGLWLRFGFPPPGKKTCLGCGRLISAYKATDYCADCEYERHRIALTCGVCGKQFSILTSDYKKRLKHKKVPMFFCSKACWGKYFGEHWGGRGRPRKWDHSKVYDLWKRTRWTVKKLSEALGMPLGTTYRILRTYRD